MSNASVLQFTVEFRHVEDCGRCGVPVVMSEQMERGLRRNHATWYCLNGHPWHWPGKSDLEQAREQAERERLARLRAEEREASLRRTKESLEHQLNGTKGALAKVKKRIANGTCPACNRHFPESKLTKHIATKHPTYSTTKEGSGSHE